MIDLPFEEEFKNGKKLAVFDLDETLVHCEIKNPKKGEFQVMVNVPNGTNTKVFINFI
jgi:phosphoserine phosphatase